jgi:hypothetical protein
MGLGFVEGVAVVPMVAGDGVEHHRRTFDLAGSGVVVAAVSERSALIRGVDGGWRTAGSGEAPRVFVGGVEKGLDALP